MRHNSHYLLGANHKQRHEKAIIERIKKHVRKHPAKPIEEHKSMDKDLKYALIGTAISVGWLVWVAVIYIFHG